MVTYFLSAIQKLAWGYPCSYLKVYSCMHAYKMPAACKLGSNAHSTLGYLIQVPRLRTLEHAYGRQVSMSLLMIYPQEFLNLPMQEKI